jgi:hypothetical protein
LSDSKKIAGLIGPTLIAVTSSEMLNPHVWDAIIEPVTYQSGMLLFVAGLLIVRAHNRWTVSWPVVVTLVGWFGVLAGLGRMFATEIAQQSAKNGSTALAFEIGLLAIGFFLTFKAYSREDTGAPER